MEEINNFDKWNDTKKKVHLKKTRINFRQGEIWFVHIGQNIGYEVFGKGENFLRPVVIFRKINKNTFLAIPLTSKIIDDKFHCFIEFKDKQNSAIFTQVKTIDAKRLAYKIGNRERKTFERVEKKIVDFYNLTPQYRGKATLTKSEQRINEKIVPNTMENGNENNKKG